MKSHYILAVFVLLSVTIFSQQEKKVLIIGMDGCRSDALQIANTPNLDGLIANGIYSPDALNTDVTSSGPGWSAILTGVWSDKHLVNSNDFGNSNYENYPPLMKYVHEYSANFITASIVHWGPINSEIIQENADYSAIYNEDEEVSNAAAEYLASYDPTFMFVHFDDIDHAGHLSGFAPDNVAYIEAIEGVDAYIQPLLLAIESRPNYNNEDWLILVTTDHGGNGYSHGGGSFGERNVFVIASGDSFDQEVILAESEIVSIENCLNESYELSFDGDNDYVEIPENELFNFGSNQDFTIECRVRTSEAADVSIVGDKDWASGYNPGFVFSFSGGTWKVNIGDGDDREDINGGNISDGQWHSLAVSFDRDGEMRMYEDGIFINAVGISTIDDIDTGEGLYFGADVFTAFDYNGSIAEVRIWNEVLDAAAINAWQCVSLDETHPNIQSLVGYWKMNEAVGNLVLDDSSYGNEGLVYNAQWNSTSDIESFDYSSTPRSVDVSVTALAHLCIPLQSEWDIDGQSIISICEFVGMEELEGEISFIVYPTLGDNVLNIDLPVGMIDANSYIVISNTLGEVVSRRSIINTSSTIDIANLSAGMYIVSYHNSLGQGAQSFMKK